VVERSFRGAYYRLVVRHDSGAQLAFELEGGGRHHPINREAVTLSLRPEAINLLDKKSEHQTCKEDSPDEPRGT
jgi:hypothetical protein